MLLMMLLLLMLLMPTDAADAAASDIEKGHTTVVGSKDAFSSNRNSY